MKLSSLVSATDSRRLSYRYKLLSSCMKFAGKDRLNPDLQSEASAGACASGVAFFVTAAARS